MNRKLIGWLLSFVKPLTGKMVGAIFLGIISNLAVVALPVVGLLQGLRSLQGAAVNLPGTLLLLVALGILRGLCRYGEQYLNHDVAFSLLALLRRKIFQQIRQLGPARTTGMGSGDFITSITSDVEALEVFFAHTISPVVIFFGTTICTVGFLATYHWLLALMLLLSLLFVGIAVPISSYRQYQQVATAQMEETVALNQLVMEDIQSLGTISQFQLEASKLSDLRQQSRRLNELYQIKLRQETQIRVLGEAGLLAGVLLMLVAGVGLQLPKETVALSVVLGLSAFGPAFSLSGLGNALLVTFASGERIQRLLTETPEVTFPITDNEETQVSEVAYQKVSFAYDDDHEPVLEQLQLSLAAGESVGIGGPSGIGKSTLLKLAMRYFDPQSGNVMLNHRSLKRFSKQELRRLEGSMQQKTFIFADTIAYNIAIGKPEATTAEIEAAAKKARLDQWISELPEGYGTKIGGSERQISDGERQRIGLARLFLQEAELLLLDEPTSNLDYLNELTILANIKALQQDKTMILVSHRPTTLKIAKRTLFLKKGQLE